MEPQLEDLEGMGEDSITNPNDLSFSEGDLHSLLDFLSSEPNQGGQQPPKRKRKIKEEPQDEDNTVQNVYTSTGYGAQQQIPQLQHGIPAHLAFSPTLVAHNMPPRTMNVQGVPVTSFGAMTMAPAPIDLQQAAAYQQALFVNSNMVNPNNAAYYPQAYMSHNLIPKQPQMQQPQMQQPQMQQTQMQQPQMQQPHTPQQQITVMGPQTTLLLSSTPTHRPLTSSSPSVASPHLQPPHSAPKETSPKGRRRTGSGTNISSDQSPSPPTSPSAATNAALPSMPASSMPLKQMYELSDAFKTQLDRISWDQKCLAIPPQQEPLEQLDKLQRGTRLALEEALRDLQIIKQTVILPPVDIWKLQQLQQTLQIQLRQLEIYQAELRYIVQPEPSPRCFGALVITKQPFPKSIKQRIKTSNAAEDPVVVRLLQGAKFEVRPTGTVRADLIWEDYQGKKTEVVVQNDTQDMNQYNEAVFTELRFSQGTRLKMVRLQFRADVQFMQLGGAIGKASLESETSQPFIVLTNESQWDLTEGMLFQKSTFKKNVSEVSWHHFANLLQMHYLRSTRQDPLKPTRPLSLADLEYIHAIKFESRPTVTQRDFERFWEWFGKVVHKIRHQRHLNSLWLKGLIYGFITKEGVEELLANEEPGTFVLRFSDRIAGQFAIAYVKQSPFGREVKHYLLKPEDTSGPNKTLADFLRVQYKFQYLVEKKMDFAPEGGTIQGKYAKNDILDEFYTKKISTTVAGYEEDLDD